MMGEETSEYNGLLLPLGRVLSLREAVKAVSKDNLIGKHQLEGLSYIPKVLSQETSLSTVAWWASITGPSGFPGLILGLLWNRFHIYNWINGNAGNPGALSWGNVDNVLFGTLREYLPSLPASDEALLGILDGLPYAAMTVVQSRYTLSARVQQKVLESKSNSNSAVVHVLANRLDLVDFVAYKILETGTPWEKEALALNPTVAEDIRVAASLGSLV